MDLKGKLGRRALKSVMTEVISEEKAEKILNRLEEEEDSSGESVPIAGEDEDPKTLKEAREEQQEEEDGGFLSEVRDDFENMLDDQIEEAEAQEDDEPAMPDSFDDAAENMRTEIEEVDEEVDEGGADESPDKNE